MRPSTGVIIGAVAQVFEVHSEDLLGRARSKAVATARGALYCLLRELCATMSWPDIGREFGRDHSTVLEGARRHLMRVALDPSLGQLHDRARRLAAARLEGLESLDNVSQVVRVRVA